MADKKVTVTLIRSAIGTTDRQRRTLRALGLRRVGRSNTLTVTPAVQGMITKVAHLVNVVDAG
jgi:large subunit ribosomal protein L30